MMAGFFEFMEHGRKTNTIHIDIAMAITSVIIAAIFIFILMNLAKLRERPEALSEALIYFTAGLAVTVLFVLLATTRVITKLKPRP
ncbi:MAG: hypothetical protein DRO15_01535 [Thermoprotei archaeon]|nr:MAG: hypothetical protein DRO15_01535 [Thermoprotei archaeon]